MSMAQTVIAAVIVGFLMALWMVTLWRSIQVEDAIRAKHIEGLKQAAEFRKQHEEYRQSVAEEAARLEAAGILVPSVKSRLIAQGIYG